MLEPGKLVWALGGNNVGLRVQADRIIDDAMSVDVDFTVRGIV